MTINNVNLTQGINQASLRSTSKQVRQDFDELFQAMQANNVAGAQQAYGALQQLLPQNNAATPAATGSPDTAPAASTVAADWASLGQALQSGNMSTAQDAFTKLQSDAATAAQGQHRHHHHGGVEKAQAVYSAIQSGDAAGGTTPATGNAVGADIAALKDALKSGNTGSAQDLLAKLEQDLRTSGQSWNRQGNPYAVPPLAAASYQVAAPSSATAPSTQA